MIKEYGSGSRWEDPLLMFAASEKKMDENQSYVKNRILILNYSFILNFWSIQIFGQQKNAQKIMKN